MNNEKFAAPDIVEAKKRLLEFKRSKKELESRLAEEREIWKAAYSGGESSSWIFNSIVNKHADIIDSIPSSVCLPREKRDERFSDALSKIIPVISQRCAFEQTYSDNAWEKLKHGTAVYGVFWNNALEDGLGDVDIKQISLSNVFWDMSVKDVQDSSDLFMIALRNCDEIEACFGFDYASEKEGDRALAASLGVALPDGKCLCVDWYYRKHLKGGKTQLHYCKMVGDRLLYASECDPTASGGWYEHGQYPLIFDTLYPTDTACGFGLISLGSAVQKSINRIDENLLSYGDWASRVRFWAKRSLGVNEREFLDLDRSIVEVEGDIDEEKLRQIEISPLDDTLISLKQLKIDELKEITGSLDISRGGFSSSVTAASAISILREAGAKASRDGIEETYRAYTRIIELVIELIRQFYDGERVFRITGDDGQRAYLGFSGRELRDAENDGRRPHFDIEIKATKNSPSENEQRNNFAKSLYDSGAFNKENATQTLMMLDLMDFDGIGKLRSEIKRAYFPSEASN